MSHETGGDSGEIFIEHTNKMSAKYRLIGVDHVDISTEINVRAIDENNKDTEIAIRVLDEYTVDTEIDIKYRGYSNILTEIQPIGYNGIDSEITVRPNNRMSAIFEVQEPPQITDILEPYKDSLVRGREGYQSINYGANHSLTVGNLQDDLFQSYLQFNLFDWNPQFKVINSKLRLHYSGSIPQDVELELHLVDDFWSELGITYLNKPEPSGFIIDEFTDYPEHKYIEIEFTQTVRNWVEKTVENNGFLIKIKDNSNTSGLFNFRSRESTRPPELIITYYDTRIYSIGRSNVNAEIFVWNIGDSDILTEIEVDSVVGNSDVLTEVYVHRYEVPVPNEIEAEIIVTKEKIESEIVVSQQDDDIILSEISVSNDGHEELSTEILISNPFILTEIFVNYQESIDSELTVQRHEDDDILTEITVTRESIDSEIYIKYTDGIDTEIEIQKHSESIRYAEITVTRESILTEITPRVLESEIIDTEIQIKVADEDNIDSEITVTRENVLTEITVRVQVDDTIGSDIFIRAIGNSDIDTELTITRESVPTEIAVAHYDTVDSEIFIKYTEDIYSEILVKAVNQIETEIDVVAVSKILSEITITRPSVKAEITVPYWGDSYILTEIRPRILQVSDVNSEITVRRKASAYVFIM